MNYLSQYNIPLNSLDSNKEYTYSFVVDSEFFNFFENSQIKGGNIDVEVKLYKKSGSFGLKIWVKGYAIIPCDRCLDDYEQEINFTDNIIINLADETNFDTNDEFVTLDRNAGEINISQFIYEFSHFALPFVHYHPEGKNGKSNCNPEMLKIIEGYNFNPKDEDTTDIIDVRWEKLLEIKKNNTY